MNLLASRNRTLFILCPLLFACVLLTFWPVLDLPFVQDDWELLDAVRRNNLFSLWIHWIDPRAKLMYRPAGLMYLSLYFKLFGDLAWPAHVFSLCIHTANSICVSLIAGILIGCPGLAIAAGIIYACAVAIHLDPLCWGVGIFDLAGNFFFLAAIVLFLRGRGDRSELSDHAQIVHEADKNAKDFNRRWESAKGACSLIAYGVAALFKEHTIVLPAVLGVIVWMQQSGRVRIQTALKRLFPFLVIGTMLAFVKIVLASSPFSLPPEHPYYWTAHGGHLLGNFLRSIVWMFQSFIPFGAPDSFLVEAAAVAVFVGVATGLWINRGGSSKTIAGLFLWICIALLPVLCMPNHSYRYYATYSLPPFIYLLLLSAREYLGLLLNDRAKHVAVVMLAVVSAGMSIMQAQRKFQNMQDRSIMSDGTNGLLERALQVTHLRSLLLGQYPALPNDAVLVLQGVDLWSFAKDAGLRFWYDRDDLRVFDVVNLRRSSEGGLYVERSPSAQSQAYLQHSGEIIPIDESKIKALRYLESRLVPIAPSELP